MKKNDKKKFKTFYSLFSNEYFKEDQAMG